MNAPATAGRGSPPPRPPIVWSLAGTDSGGGAGLAADQRAADAIGVHLCPVVAAITAQHSRAVTRVVPVDAALLDAQIDTLAEDLPPQALKTGLLGSAEAVRRVAHWIVRLRARFGPVPLVVDPVLGASTGAAFADAATLDAYRHELLPLATVVTPNLREARQLLGVPAADGASTTPADAPTLAAALRALGPDAVVVTGGDEPCADLADQALDWLDSAQACGWLALPRVGTPHTHGTGCTHATALAGALALGHPAADAAVLAKMLVTEALRRGRAAGACAGPVVAHPDFAVRADQLPVLSCDARPQAWVPPQPAATGPTQLYGIVDRASRLPALLSTGLRRVQLRLKSPASAAALQRELQQAAGLCEAAGAELIVNDHWREALAAGLRSIHLGQDDLLALSPAERQALRAVPDLRLGLSSHSLWELARSRGLAPTYIACGPVWATTTKAMPWRPQGLHNLRWWARLAGRPVVAIGGVLQPAQARDAAQAGAAAVCLVRALDAVASSEGPAALDAWARAVRTGTAARDASGTDGRPALPHPCLP